MAASEKRILSPLRFARSVLFLRHALFARNFQGHQGEYKGEQKIATCLFC